MPLDERERLVVNCQIMRLREEEALAYLRAHGFEIRKSTYYCIKSRLAATKLNRLYGIARKGFVDQHLERLDQLELVQQEMWKNYHLERDLYKKVRILKMIADVQPYISAYVESTKEVMEHNALFVQEGIGLPAPRKAEAEGSQ